VCLMRLFVPQDDVRQSGETLEAAAVTVARYSGAPKTHGRYVCYISRLLHLELM
jgi:hypothetical protein